MRKIRIVIMGITGVGKSTIINALLENEEAKTGCGGSVTKENSLYSCIRTIDGDKCELSLYDTVGLEVDEKITNNTLAEIKEHIEKSKMNSEAEDVNIVWFCVNELTHRFEDYEVDLVKKLSIEYEIPFVIVLTQCISRKNGELADYIEQKMPEIPIRRVMAKDYDLDAEHIINAFGLDELLLLSVNDYYKYKIDIIESKIDELMIRNNTHISSIESRGKICIDKYAKQAGKVGWIPVGCMPFVYSKCKKMILELNTISGFGNSESFVNEIFTDVVTAIIIAPTMAVPFLSSFSAQAYVETIGENYLNAIIEVVKDSSESELKDAKLMKARIKRYLEKK